MKRTNIYTHAEHMDQLAVLANARGLKVSQLVRIAIREFLHRERRKEVRLLIRR